MYLEYTTPVLKNSTKEISVRNRHNEEVLILQKFFKNKLEQVLSSLRPGMFTNIIVKENNKTVVISNDKFSFGRTKWEVDFQGSSIMLMDKSVTAIHPRAVFEVNGKEYQIELNFGDKRVMIYSNARDKIAELTHEKMVPSKCHISEVFHEEIDLRLLLCIVHTFSEVY